MIKGIVFDLDGTLIQLPTNYELIQENLKNTFQTNEHFSPLIPTIIKKSNHDKLKIKKAFDMICEQEILASKNLQINKGLHDIFLFLKSQDIVLCLVTMQCRKAAVEILKKLRIIDHFSNIFSRDESFDRLEQIQMTLKKMKLEPQNTLVIGDRLHDMDCAKKAGCNRLLFSNKNESYGELQIIDDLMDIKEVL